MASAVLSRRALLSATPSVALVAAASATVVSAQARPSVIPAEWANFIRAQGWAHPGGAAAAINAYRAGVDLNDLYMVSYRPWGAPNDPTMAPILMFLREGDTKMRSFRPRGEDQ